MLKPSANQVVPRYQQIDKSKMEDGVLAYQCFNRADETPFNKGGQKIEKPWRMECEERNGGHLRTCLGIQTCIHEQRK